jgi:integrase
VSNESRRLRGTGALFRRKSDGLWVARVSLGVRNGKRVQRELHGHTQEEAEAHLRQMRRLAGVGLDPIAGRQLLEGFLGDWLVSVTPTVRKATAVSYAAHVKNHIAPVLGGISVGKLMPSDVRALMADRQAAGTSASTVGRILVTLRMALGSGVRDGILERNVAALVKPPRVERDAPRGLTPAEAMRLVKAIADDWLGPLYVLLLATGLRLGEACALNWRDLDLDGLTVAVRSGKTRRSVRTVPILAFALPHLRAHRARAADIDPDAPVFRGQRQGKRLTGYVASQHWPRVLTERKLRPIKAHDLRHAHASLMLAAGVPMRVIADQLGHASPALTANVYAHLTGDALGDASRAVDDLLKREG